MTKVIIKAADGTGAVEAYHNANKKLETTATGTTVTGNIAVTGTVDGRDIATDGAKLDGIAAGANVGAALTGSTNNTVCTVTGANAIQGEANLTFDGSALNATAGAASITIKSTNAQTAGQLHFDGDAVTSADYWLGNINGRWNGNDVAAIRLEAGSDTTNKDDGLITFHTSDASSTPDERMRIDKHGRWIIGSSSSYYSWGENPYSQLHGTDFSTSGKTLTRWSNDASPPWLLFNKSRGGIGTQTTVQSGDGVGGIGFIASDGTDLNNDAARIATYIDGTPASNVVPGRIKFATTKSNGQASWKLDIRAGGDVEVMEGHLVLSSPGKGINFHPHGGSGANTLDDYEEGTFTPTWHQGATSITYHIAQGNYTKIGRYVYGHIYLYTSCTANSDHLKIGGLPFSSGASSVGFGGAHHTYTTSGMFSGVSGGNGIKWHVPASATVMNAYTPTGSGVAGDTSGVTLHGKEILLSFYYHTA